MGNQTADNKKPNQPLPIHQLPLPWLQLWFVANLQRYHGCGEEPQPVQSLPVSAVGASGTHCCSSAFCHLCVLSKPGTCSGCKVLKKSGHSHPSTALAHHHPVPWAGTHNVPMLASQAAAPQHHCLAWLQPWLFQAWRTPHTNLTSNTGDFITLLGESGACKEAPSLIFSPEHPLTLKALSHLNKPIGSPELREWTVSSYHTNGSLKQILKPREGIKQWVELEASKSIERDKSKITINSLPLFYYLIASKHRLSFLMTLKNLRSHFLSMCELFWDAHIQEQKKASSWCVQCQAALAMWLPLNTSQPKAVALTEDTGAARAAKRAGTCPENRESKGLRTTSSCWKPK